MDPLIHAIDVAEKEASPAKKETHVAFTQKHVHKHRKGKPVVKEVPVFYELHHDRKRYPRNKRPVNINAIIAMLRHDNRMRERRNTYLEQDTTT